LFTASGCKSAPNINRISLLDARRPRTCGPGRRQTSARVYSVPSPRLIDRARSSSHQTVLTDGKTATADDSSLSPPRPNISRLDQVAGLQLTVTQSAWSRLEAAWESRSRARHRIARLDRLSCAESGRVKRRKKVPAARSMCSKPSPLTRSLAGRSPRTVNVPSSAETSMSFAATPAHPHAG